MQLLRWCRREYSRIASWWGVLLLVLGISPLGGIFFIVGTGSWPILLIPASTIFLVYNYFSLNHGLWARYQFIGILLLELESKLPRNIPKRDNLEAQATEVFQIEALIDRTQIGEFQRRRIVKEANDRMWRLVSIAVNGPGDSGLTIAQAQAQVQADDSWLRRARTLVESFVPDPWAEPESELLRELGSHSAAREQALEELFAG